MTTPKPNRVLSIESGSHRPELLQGPDLALRTRLEIAALEDDRARAEAVFLGITCPKTRSYEMGILRLAFVLLAATLLVLTLAPLAAAPEPPTPPTAEELRLRRDELRLMDRQTRALESIAKELERMRREG